MKKRVFLLALILFSFSFYSIAQDLDYARQVIKDLTAEDMHGRGYVNDGDEIAAFYIKEQMEDLGVLSFEYNFYQDFTMKVNTFPGAMILALDGNKLEAGKDYLVAPQSKSVKGKFELLYLNLNILVNKELSEEFAAIDKSNKFIVIDPSQVENDEQKKYFDLIKGNPFKAKGIIELKEKLTWGVAQTQPPYVVLEILSNSFITKANQIELNIGAKFESKHRSQNIIGFIEGKEHPDSFVVFSAHYDHLGRMGQDVYFPGANDNASGISMLLNLAKHYTKPENTPKYTLVFIAFGAEEAGLIGSKYFVENPLFPLEDIKFLLNLDLLGTGEEGITVVNATKHMKEYNWLVELNEKHDYLEKVKKRGPAANSDHHHFVEKGVPAFFIYTMGGIAAYHDIYDIAETLPLTEYADVFHLITDFLGTFETPEKQ